MSIDETIKQLSHCYDEHKDRLVYRTQTEDKDVNGKYISYCCVEAVACPYNKDYVRCELHADRR